VKPARVRAALAALGLLPAAIVTLVPALIALLSSRSPSRYVLDRAWAPPSLALPFGAGEAGIDLLAAVSHSTARGLVLAFCVTLVGFLVGTPLGAAAGLSGGGRAAAVGRACDLVQAFPTFLLALTVLSAVKSPSRLHIGLVFCFSSWAPFARLSLLQAQVLSSAQFVEAAAALGATRARVVIRHVLPNLLGPVAVQAGSAAAAVVLGEAALGFLGLGPRDGVSLGALLEQGTIGMLRAPHVLVVSASAVALVSGSLQIASEVLRARLGHRSS
jgi:ABC-type dipeptide/oligopeptide/nickel transport system permease subunit